MPVSGPARCGIWDSWTSPNPSPGLFTQGMVTHETYSREQGRRLPPLYFSPTDVDPDSNGATLLADGQPVDIGRVIKMSKSKKNVVDPDDIIAKYAATRVRCSMLSDSPPGATCLWTRRASKAHGGSSIACGACSGKPTTWRWRRRQGADRNAPGIDGIAKDIEALSSPRVAKIYERTSAVEKAQPSASRTDAIRTLALLVAPMTLHLAEAWADMGQDGLIADAAWPAVDPALVWMMSHDRHSR